MRQRVVKQRERREDMQTRRTSTFALHLVTMLAFVGALALLGCPSDDEDDAVIIGTQAVVLRPGNAGVLGGETFLFPGPDGVPAFGTRATEVVFNEDASGATFSTATRRTSADVAYGSCIFTPGEDSTFPPGSPLAPGADPIEIVLCNLIVNGGEFTVGGLSGPCTIALELGAAVSGLVDAVCSIDADGRLVVYGLILTGSVGGGD
jgi:hypothetical protein